MEATEIEIAIDRTGLRAGVDALNRLLADEFVLYAKTKNYHWNVTGAHFGPLHKMLEEQYEKLDEVMDEVAERVRMLGGIARATLREFGESSSIEERSPEGVDECGLLCDLLADHETVARSLRDAIDASDQRKDHGTSDLLSGILRGHEKTAWMLRAHLVDTLGTEGTVSGVAASATSSISPLATSPPGGPGDRPTGAGTAP